MARDSVVSQQLKTLHEELSASQKERAASSLAGDAPETMAEPITRGLRYHALVAPRGSQRRFVDEVHQVGAGEARRAAGHGLQVDIGNSSLGCRVSR